MLAPIIFTLGFAKSSYYYQILRGICSLTASKEAGLLNPAFNWARDYLVSIRFQQFHRYLDLQSVHSLHPLHLQFSPRPTPQRILIATINALILEVKICFFLDYAIPSDLFYC